MAGAGPLLLEPMIMQTLGLEPHFFIVPSFGAALFWQVCFVFNTIIILIIIIITCSFQFIWMVWGGASTNSSQQSQITQGK